MQLREYRHRPDSPPWHGITCFWFRRTIGRVAEKVPIKLSYEQCVHFRIWEPRMLDRPRAERIEAWGRQQAIKEWP